MIMLDPFVRLVCVFLFCSHACLTSNIHCSGFAWNIRGDVFWQKHYDALVAYKKEHGDVKVPRLYPKNPKLGECEFQVLY